MAPGGAPGSTGWRAAAWCPPSAARAGLDALLSGFGVLLYLLSLAVSYLIAAFEHSRAAERRGLQVQVLAREAELRTLRAQIDPHFCSTACTRSAR